MAFLSRGTHIDDELDLVLEILRRVGRTKGRHVEKDGGGLALVQAVAG